MEVIAALYYYNRDGAIYACDLYQYRISMLVFHQSNGVSATKHMFLYYRHISTFVLFQVFVCSV